jgi:hypothetical protein
MLSIALAASISTAASAASKHKHHATAAMASKTDWPGNPYMDSRPDQVASFWRDAFNPWGATAK